MTKAKTKSRRVWLPLDADGQPQLDLASLTRDGAKSLAEIDTGIDWDELHSDGWRVVPATLTWTPPAKAPTKRRAKR